MTPRRHLLSARSLALSLLLLGLLAHVTSVTNPTARAHALDVMAGTFDGEYVYTWTNATTLFFIAGFDEAATHDLALLVSQGGATPLPHPSPPHTPTSGSISLTLTVDGIIQTEDLWTTGDTPVNEWAKPMYYFIFDDNGDPSDGAYGNQQGPAACVVWLDTGNLGFKWRGSDRQWDTDDDVRYYPLYEAAPGKWEGQNITAMISSPNQLNVTLPLALFGMPTAIDVSCMTSPWTTTALDNLGPGAYGSPAWLSISNTSSQEEYTVTDEVNDTYPWPVELDPAPYANFDIRSLEVHIEAPAPPPAPSPASDDISPSTFLPTSNLPSGVTLETRLLTGPTLFSYPLPEVLQGQLAAAALGVYRLDATDAVIRVLVMQCTSTAAVIALDTLITDLLDDFALSPTTLVVPTATTITCHLAAETIAINAPLTVTGAITPAISGSSVTLCYVAPDGNTVTRTVITDATGHYQDDYAPATLGVWTLNASWIGNATYQGASSTSVSFSVTPQSSESAQLPWYVFLIAGVVGSLVVGSLFAIRRRHIRPPVMHPPPVCTRCGTPIPRDAAFCPECGTSHRVSSTRER